MRGNCNYSKNAGIVFPSPQKVEEFQGQRKEFVHVETHGEGIILAYLVVTGILLIAIACNLLAASV